MLTVTVKDKSTTEDEAVVHFEGRDEQGVIVKLSLSGPVGFEEDYEVSASYAVDLLLDEKAPTPAKSRRKREPKTE